MVESSAKEASEEDMLEALMFGHEAIKELCVFQEEIIKEIGKEKMEYQVLEITNNLKEEVKDLDIDAILAHNKRRGGCCGSARGRGPLNCGKPMPDHANPNIHHHSHDKKTCCGYNE